jgi:alpha-D-xyloside xylohydrolase
VIVTQPPETTLHPPIDWRAIAAPLDVASFPPAENHLRRWTRYAVGPTGVTFDCETGAGDPAIYRVDVIEADVIRVRMARAGDAPRLAARSSEMLVRADWPAIPFECRQVEDAVILTTPRLRLEFQRFPWQLRAYALTHCEEIASAQTTGLAMTGAWQQDAPSPVPFFAERVDDRAYGPGYEVLPVGFEAGIGGREAVREAVAVTPGEAFYGFGEKFTPLDKWGQELTSWTVDCGNVTSGRSYKNVPFFISSAGYGLFIHSSYPIVYRMGSESAISYSFHVAEPCLDYFLIYGPDYAHILRRYAELTGFAPIPPKWSFGFWLSRAGYRSQAEVEEIARELRTRGFPCDVISLDPWWMGDAPWSTYEWDRRAFPQPEAMIQTLREQGIRTCLWIHPYVPAGTALHAEGAARGYFVRRDRALDAPLSPVQEAFSGAELAAIDFTNPDAVAWFQGKLDALLEMGVAVFKSDFGEQAPVEAVYADGRDGVELHNLYPLLYNRAVFETTERRFGRGLTWARSGYAGSQRYPVHWGGDSYSSLDQMAGQLRGLLSFGMSGVPFCSHDIGGFDYAPPYFDHVSVESFLETFKQTERDAYPKDATTYVRWLQFGAFSSHMRAHGKQPHEPWTYGPEAEAIARRYLALRYRLLPYIYSQAVISSRTGLPLVRPMALAFQDDPTTRRLDGQYMFGDSILVAPVVRADGRCQVYLPAGVWVDFWTHEVTHGPAWLNLTAALDTLPLWVRGGAILPWGPEQDFVDQKPLDPLTIELYAPEDAGSCTIYDEDRPAIEVSYRRPREKDAADGGDLIVTISPTPGMVELICRGASVQSARVNGADTPLTAAGALGFDGRAGGVVALHLCGG